MAHAGDYSGIPFGYLIDLANDILGKKRISFPDFQCRMLVSPFIHLIKPVQVFTGHNLLIQNLKNILNITDNGHINLYILAYLGRVDINMNNPSLRRKVADHAVARSSNRIPIATITSEWCTALLA